jgi:hypothetical protein
MIDTLVWRIELTDLATTARERIISQFKTKENGRFQNMEASMHIKPLFRKHKIDFRLNVPSSHYNLLGVLDDTEKKITFNYSVPKFFYGTNIFHSYLHFYYNHNLPEKYNQTFGIDYSTVIALSSIFDIIELIAPDELSTNEILDSVYIERVDICRNYLFDSPEHVKAYIKELKTAKMRFKEVGKADSYGENGLMYVFQDYSVKCYHKGEETKDDLDEFSDLFDDYELQEIQQIANRTLRYECTFRAQKIRNIFLKTFRKKCDIFKELPMDIKQKFAAGGISADMRLRSTSYYKMTDVDEFNLMMKPNGRRNSKYHPQRNFAPLFDIETMRQAYVEASKLFDCMQVAKRPYLGDLKRCIEDHNNYLIRTGNKPYKIAPILKIFNLMTRKTLWELEEEGVISRASVYNYIAKFKRLGLKINGNTKLDSYIDNKDHEMNGALFLQECLQFNDRLLRLTMEMTNRHVKPTR